jgi:hypothetical protein
LETKAEYDYSYDEFRKILDSDRAKKELGHALGKNLHSYIQSSFLPKEHQIVRYLRSAVRAFDYCTLCQVEHENKYIKAHGGK